ncbi:unnamed protein product [Gongylonema pulchrum]|uniref:Transposase n=1 Tax=Gongylonema pulchrum TaxID=637853 RepID=A0A183DMA8_9BILA|nr:unnamed protein product [Gongylonema pulchrum]
MRDGTLKTSRISYAKNILFSDCFSEYSRKKFRDFVRTVEIGLQRLDVRVADGGLIDLTEQPNGMPSKQRKRKLMLAVAR